MRESKLCMTDCIELCVVAIKLQTRDVDVNESKRRKEKEESKRCEREQHKIRDVWQSGDMCEMCGIGMKGREERKRRTLNMQARDKSKMVGARDM